MAKKVLTLIKLQIPGGQANPAPPVGPALGQHGVNIMEFCKAFNAADPAGERPHHPGRDHGLRGPLVHVHHEDAAGRRPHQGGARDLDKGSGEPNREKVGRLTRNQVRSIAEIKLVDLNARDIDEASKVIAGTARSMGVEVDLMTQHGKRYREARARRSTASRVYSPLEAIRILKSAPPAKFDETVEVHFHTGLNVRHADQQLRGTLMLPHGSGKDVARRRLRRGREGQGGPGRRRRRRRRRPISPAQIEGGFDDFDVTIATPDMMGTVGRLGRILGPRGKMPNPKAGTVTFDVGKAVSDAKAGKLEYRTDRGANVHLALGKRSFDERALLENYAAILDEIVRARPAAAKGRYLRSVTLTSSMGPGIKIDPRAHARTSRPSSRRSGRGRPA